MKKRLFLIPNVFFAAAFEIDALKGQSPIGLVFNKDTQFNVK
jgi:hypothetical protein